MKYLQVPGLAITFLFAMSILIVPASTQDDEDVADDGDEGSPRHPHTCDDPLKEFVSCQSTGCIKTCANPNPIQCTLDCAHGCFCRDGYVLDESKERCVQVHNCTTLCRQNEEYRECQLCEPTCRESQPACPANCADSGKGSCYCKPGFVRNSIGLCIKSDDCA